MTQNRLQLSRRPVYSGRTSFIVLITGLVLPLAVIEALLALNTGRGNTDQVTWLRSHGRHLLQIDTDLNCTPRSAREFPDDFMTEDQRRHGGIVFHILFTLYLFAATALACDNFFVPSLKKIADVCQIPPDVAGATIMAAGSSAPEFFAAVIGVFFAKSDIGLSTIVGSAIFNLLFVNAVCGMFAGMVIYLVWSTIVRDCLVYALSVAVLIIVIFDEKVHWYESGSMVLLYILYVTLMYINERMKKAKAKLKHDQAKDTTESEKPLLSDGKTSSGELKASRRQTSLVKYVRYGSLPESRTDTDDESDSLLKAPKGFWARVVWVIMLPVSFLMVFTIPDFRRGGCWEKLYPMTFLLSVTWIGGFCYIMVWMVTIIGDTFSVPDTVMGLTMLAVGSSVPDAIGSFLVAKDGYGDMAVSNTVGSNVFDILLCLGLPWFLQTAVIQPNTVIHITSRGLTYSSIALLAADGLLVLAFLINKWRLTKIFGVGCLLAYLIIVVLSSLYELNVFGYYNLPICP